MNFKRTKLWLSLALALAKRPGRDKSVTVVLAAAGSSVRFGKPKPLVEIAARHLFEYSLEAFLHSRYVREIIIAVRKEDEAIIESVLKTRFAGKPVSTCLGGASRDESVKNAFLRASEESRFIAFHDAARPLIRTEDIDRVIQDAFRYGAATAGSRVVDSVKRVKDGKIIEDVERDGLYAVTTPQIFLKDLYEVSRAICEKDAFSSTDDNAYVSHAGFSIHVTDVQNNPKLTYPDDLLPIQRELFARKGEQA